MSLSEQSIPPDANRPRDSRRPGKRQQNQLLALGSAAVLAVYSAGYLRTREAARQFDAADLVGRRSTTPSQAIASVEPVSAGAAISAAEAVAAPETKKTLETAAPAASPATPAVASIAPTPPAASLPKTDSVVGTSPVAEKSPVAVVAAAVEEKTSAPAAIPSSPPIATMAAPSVPAAPVALATSSSVETVVAKIPEAPKPKWKDGKFSGWGSCRHGEIQATIEIKGGRIISAVVSDCRTRYSCDVIDAIIPQVVARQSADVDTVSGATQSADAFYYAVTAALAAAKPDLVKAL